MKQTIKKAVLFGITFLSTILIGFVGYAAWTNLTEVAPTDSLTATLWNNLIGKVNDIGTRTDGIYSSGGNVGIGISNPDNSKLHVGGGVINLDDDQSIAFGGGTSRPGIKGNKAIGYLSLNTSGLERFRIDLNGNVGIGTTTPIRKLHITRASAVEQILEQSDAKVDYRKWNLGVHMGNSTTASDFFIRQLNDAGTAGIMNFYIKGNGNIGIGTETPGYKLTVNGQPAANGYTAFTNYSDRRLKENINNIGSGVLDKIVKLNPVSFQYNDKYFDITGYDKKTKQKEYKGFIAQELKKVFPEMVNEKEISGEKYLDTDLSSLQIYLLKAIQEQNEYIKKLQKRIEILENK